MSIQDDETALDRASTQIVKELIRSASAAAADAAKVRFCVSYLLKFYL